MMHRLCRYEAEALHLPWSTRLRSYEAKRTLVLPWAEGSLHRAKPCFIFHAPQVRFIEKRPSRLTWSFFWLREKDLNHFAQRLRLCLHTQNIVASLTAVPDTPCFCFFIHPFLRPPDAGVDETPCHEPLGLISLKGALVQVLCTKAQKNKAHHTVCFIFTWYEWW